MSQVALRSDTEVTDEHGISRTGPIESQMGNTVPLLGALSMLMQAVAADGSVRRLEDVTTLDGRGVVAPDGTIQSLPGPSTK